MKDALEGLSKSSYYEYKKEFDKELGEKSPEKKPKMQEIIIAPKAETKLTAVVLSGTSQQIKLALKGLL